MRFLRRSILILSFIFCYLVSLVAHTPTHTIIFQTEACIKPFKGYEYLTCDAMRVIIDGQHYVIPKNFKTDLASIPRPLWPFIAPQYTGFVPPAILHDYLYSCGNLGSRGWADEVLYSALISEGITKQLALNFYLAVRLFGASNFNSASNYCSRIAYE
jgi:hypothetical protein